MNKDSSEHDIVIIGAGVCGIYMLYRAREIGLRVTLVEKGDGPGGTWYWNRYPGARFDSESYTYGYSFSKELLAEWNWTERFASQPETLRYLNHVVDRFDLRQDMQFGRCVKAARFNEKTQCWQILLEDGDELRTRFLITAIGMLSAPTLPRIDGLSTFGGESFHTYHWPREGIDLDRKSVAVIGTGATAVQLIPEVAKVARHLTVFQRRPNWCAPLHNGSLDAEEMAQIKEEYEEIFAQCARTPSGFIHGPDRRDFDSLSDKAKEEFWEGLYHSPGFGKWLGNFVKVLVDPGANAEYSEFIAAKIRERVNDPKVARKLVPIDHGFGSRRVPLETDYYEAFNRDNVELIDLNETPIERITKTGIQTNEREFEFDLIVYATGFDAITGSFDRISIEGKAAQSLRAKWFDGPQTYLGLQTRGFPNLLTLAGPQSASVGTNFPRGIEDAVDWTIRLLQYMSVRGYRLVEPSLSAENAWTTHVKESYEAFWFHEVKSWFNGYNSNVDRHDRIRHLVYFGGAPEYRTRINEIASRDYEGFEFA